MDRGFEYSRVRKKPSPFEKDNNKQGQSGQTGSKKVKEAKVLFHVVRGVN